MVGAVRTLLVDVDLDSWLRIAAVNGEYGSVRLVDDVEMTPEINAKQRFLFMHFDYSN